MINTATEGFGAIVFQLLRGFEAVAVAVLASFVTAPAYLVVLRRRDDAGKDTSGLVLHGVALFVALAVFIAVAGVLAMPVMG